AGKHAIADEVGVELVQLLADHPGNLQEDGVDLGFAVGIAHGLMNFRTNSSFGIGGSGVLRSRGSLGLRRKSPSAARRKPAASISRRTNASSTRWSVPDSEMPVPGRPEWSATTYTPPGLSAAKTARFMRARSTPR